MRNQTSMKGGASTKRDPKIDQTSKRISKEGALKLSTSTTSTPGNTLGQSAARHPLASKSVKGGQD